MRAPTGDAWPVVEGGHGSITLLAQLDDFSLELRRERSSGSLLSLSTRTSSPEQGATWWMSVESGQARLANDALDHQSRMAEMPA